MPAAKRTAPAADEPRRRSVRVSITPKKSAYFESGSESESEEETKPKKRGRPAKKAKVESDSSEDQYQEQESEDEQAQEEEEEEDDDEDAPPKVTIVPLEKLRDTGGIEYEDGKVHMNTMLFLKDLKAHNQRPWLKAHDKEYRRALQDWTTFLEVATSTIAEADETIPELPVKDVNFRIHRDVRFSKDPTPYKPHFSAAWSRTGRKGPYACYYVHCEPNASFVGGGLWCPEKAHIDKLRRSIDRRPQRWREVLNEPRFRGTFLPGAKKQGAEAAVKAFIEGNKQNALKIKPMGYEADHRDIGLLRLRNYTVGVKVDDALFQQDDAQEKLGEIIAAMCPYVSFLNDIVMPDPNLESDDDSATEGGEDEGDGDAEDEVVVDEEVEDDG